MPWTTKDVEKHKKGLTDKQKKQWVRIANSALARCLKKGGTDKTCAPSAIKQANGVVGNSEPTNNLGMVKVEELENYLFVSNIQEEGYEVEIKVHQGKPYLVVPVVMMVEGVHAGNYGPLLHTMEELGKFPESWNGRPAMINHPKVDGVYVSANSPDMIDDEAIGRVYNTKMDGYKLKAEVWMDEDKLNDISADLLEDINEGKPIEVSTGMFVEEEEISGFWHEEKYIAVARNIRPDHLALLPGGVGACSIEDGCGIRNNKKGGNDMKIQEAIKTLRPAGYSIQQLGNYAEQGYKELMDLIYNKLRSMDSQNVWHYLEELYDDSLVYCKSGGLEPKMYKQGYKISDGKVEFIGDPVEVRKEVKFVLAENSSGMSRTKSNSSNINIDPKKEVEMTKKGDEKPCCEDLVKELIANERTKFTDDDKETLLAMKEEFLTKLIPVEPEVKKDDKQNELPLINAEQALEVLRETIKTTEDFIKVVPEEMRDSLSSGLKLHNEKRASMVKDILDNTGDTWNKEELEKMNFETLRKVHRSIPEIADYTALGDNGRTVIKEGRKPLLPAGVEIEEPKK